MNKPTFKTINFRGKEYVEVKERIGFLRYEFEGDYELTTDYQYYEDRQMWIAKATLTLHMDGKSFTYTGHAQELESSSNINKTSALENAETSAIGRACAAAGIGIDTAFASANEMEKAINREKANTKQAPKARPTPKDLEAYKALLSNPLVEDDARAKKLAAMKDWDIQELVVNYNKLLGWIEDQSKTATA
jgi:hypothetical protein